jgi:histidyl-tRNA synthetase
MYIFEDKNNDLVALRPENTAGVVRAFISNHMAASAANPANVFYHGPMFRHERCLAIFLLMRISLTL